MTDEETNDEQYKPIEIPSLDFLKHCVFNYGKYKKDEDKNKDKDKIISMAADAAYLDMCRTLSKKEGSDAGHENMREEGIKVLRKAIKEGLARSKKFDVWHNDTCKALMAVYNDSSDSKYKLTYGQAQKWLNMTMKYLLVLDYETALEHVEELHAPIDKEIVAQIKKDELDVPIKFKRWSKIDIDNGGEKCTVYDDFQVALRKAVEKKWGCRILWEFDAWNRATEEN